jgi:formylglycine-generating enzyme required for sulfatase activity
VACALRAPTPYRCLVLLGLALTLTACHGGGGGSSSTSGNSASGSDAPHKEITTKSGVAMIYLPGGQFTMGSDRGNPDEAPPHKVTVSAFLMDKVPVTNAMYAQAQVPNPSHWPDNPKFPVERVRWRDAKLYCNERSRLEGLKPCYNEKTSEWDCDYTADGYRLPTEAEWEYAARAGSDGPYDFGGKDALRQYAWYADNSDQTVHPVGDKRPNKWGLYDMYGNVSVWCEDVYDPDYYKTSPAVDPHGPPSPGKDVKRVLRGGNWKASADMCRATYRQGERTGDTDACFATDYCGLRCVRRVTPQQLASLRGGK